jgi:hypothetical protein
MSVISNKATLDTTAFNAGLNKMQGGVKSLASSLKSIPGLGGALSAAAVMHGFDSVLKSADEIDNLAKQADIGTEALQALKFKAEESGVSFEAMLPAISKLRQAMAEANAGSITFEKTFAALGISMNQVRGSSTEEMLGLVANAMAASNGEAGAAVAANDLLGAKATKLNKIFLELGAEGLQEYINKLKQANLISSKETISSLDQLEERFNRLKKSAQVAGMFTVSAFVAGAQFLPAYVGALSAGSTASEAMAIALKTASGQMEELKNETNGAADALAALQKLEDKQVKAQVELDKLMFNEQFGQLPIDEQIENLEKMAEEQKRIASEALVDNDSVARLEAYKRLLEIEKQLGNLQDEQDKKRKAAEDERVRKLRVAIDANQAEDDAVLERARLEQQLQDETNATNELANRINAPADLPSGIDLSRLALSQIRGKSESKGIERQQQRMTEYMRKQTELLGEIANNSQGVF